MALASLIIGRSVEPLAVLRSLPKLIATLFHDLQEILQHTAFASHFDIC
jgi:hypothetical protein